MYHVLLRICLNQYFKSYCCPILLAKCKGFTHKTELIHFANLCLLIRTWLKEEESAITLIKNVSSRNWNWVLVQCTMGKLHLEAFLFPVSLPSWLLTLAAPILISSTNRHNTYTPMVLFIGPLVDKWSVKSFNCHKKNQFWNVLEGCGNTSGSLRGWRTVTEKDRNQGTLEWGSRHTCSSKNLKTSTLLSNFSSLLKLRCQPPEEIGWLAKVRSYDHSPAVHG